MKYADVVLMDEQGADVWEGSLREFFRDNGMGRADARAIIDQLRPRQDTGHMEPATIGGGAAPQFELMLIGE
jgi:hypothetical protein